MLRYFGVALATVEVGRTADYGIWLRTPARAQTSRRALLGSLEPLTTLQPFRSNGLGAMVGAEANRGGFDAEQARERQEREAVRSAEGQGDVQGARREDREFSRRVQPWRQEVARELLPLVLESGWDD